MMIAFIERMFAMESGVEAVKSFIIIVGSDDLKNM